MILAINGKPNSGKDLVGFAIRFCLFKQFVNEQIKDKEDIDYILAQYSFTKALEDEYHTKVQLSRVFSLNNFEIKKFADLPNKMYFKLTNVNYSNSERDIKEKHRPQFRKFAENIKEIFGQDIWTKQLLNNYTERYNWVITDLRFPVEYNEVKKYNGKTIKIIGKEIEDNHYVENSLDNVNDWDYLLDNSGDYEHLFSNVEKMLNELNIKPQLRLFS